MKKRIHYITPDMPGPMSTIKVSIKNPTTTTTAAAVTFTAASNVAFTRLQGTVTYVPHTNGGIEFELPFYSNNLFVWACTADPFTTASVLNATCTRNYSVDYATNCATAGVLYEESAIAEDFSLLRWIAAPAFVV